MTTKKPTFSNTRKTSFNLDKLKSKINDKDGKSKYKDDRFWSLTVDKDGNGEAVVRFLPGLLETDDDIPYVEVYKHFYQGPGGILSENCLKTVGEQCPICAKGYEFYTEGKKGDEAKKAMGQKLNKSRKYYANIYMIHDAGNPENNGKVFLYEIPSSIFDKLIERMESTDADLPPIIPFALDETGADFKIKAHIDEKKKLRSYSKSFYKTPNELDVTAKELDAILSQQFSLKEFTDASNKDLKHGFKTVDKLEERINKVLKEKSMTSTVEDVGEEEEVAKPSVTKQVAAKSQPVEEEVETLDEEIDVDEEIEKLING